MAAMGNGYGSECHLLRYLGRHRRLLDQRIIELVPGPTLEWLDFPFDASKTWQDGEWKGLEFLGSSHPVQKAWREYWPQGAGIHNWDAVARRRIGGEDEWWLIEAKAHEEELVSDCGAKAESSRRQICAALGQTKKALGVTEDRDWCRHDYQFCNRLAVLHFFSNHAIPARLLFIYITGDKLQNRRCPATEGEWERLLAQQAVRIGLSGGHCLESRIHKLFLPVCPQ